MNNSPTALTSTVTALQTRFESVTQDRYIDITHAVPTTFHFSQLPSSPVSTPNRAPTGSEMGDYFSLPRTVVFAKAAVANDHASALQAASENPRFPPWPQTVVAPSSINISVLERYIPPASVQEYRDLFSLDQPSALVDRLLELHPDNGSLILIYPTALGASTFKERYLNPILAPLLRTLAGLHGLSMGLIGALGEFGVPEKMLAYGGLENRIRMLIAKLAQARGCRYEISASSRQVLQLERDAWAAWFTEQETPRFRQVMNSYFQRAVMLPSDKNITASTLVREIVDGVKRRAYDQRDARRNGIEVGVFVLKRRA